MSFVHLEKVSYTYGSGKSQHLALKEITLSIEAGEFVAIVGASGSGKSTLLYLLGLLVRPTEGRISWNGESLWDGSPDERAARRGRWLGFIFQRFELQGRVSAQENVAAPAHWHELALRPETVDERARNLLGMVGLADKARNKPHELSGGQKQRVAIARALFLDPECILADEPTGALDSRSASEVMELLSRLHAMGKTVVIVTHDAQVARRAGRVIEIRDGQIISDRRNAAVTKADIESLARSASDALSDSSRRSAPRALLAQSRRAISSLTAARRRSLLTMLSIGLGALIMTLCGIVGNLLADSATLSQQKVAARTFSLLPSGSIALGESEIHHKLKQLGSEMEPFGRLLPSANQSCVLHGKSVEIQSISSFEIQEALTSGLPPARGRGLLPDEIEEGHAVAAVSPAFLNQQVQEYGDRLPTLSLEGCGIFTPVRIVGVLRRSGSRDSNATLFIPHTLLSATDGGHAFQNALFVAKPGLADAATAQLKARLKKSFHIEFEVISLGKNQARLIGAAIKILGYLMGILALAVSGTGVVNIMLVNLRERLRELGVMRSFGASRDHVASLMRMETVMLCLFGGAIGTLAGLAVGGSLTLLFALRKTGFCMSLVGSVLAPLDLALICGVCLMFGLVCGRIPARRAANLDPFTCLR